MEAPTIPWMPRLPQTENAIARVQRPKVCSHRWPRPNESVAIVRATWITLAMLSLSTLSLFAPRYVHVLAAYMPSVLQDRISNVVPVSGIDVCSDDNYDNSLVQCMSPVMEFAAGQQPVRYRIVYPSQAATLALRRQLPSGAWATVAEIQPSALSNTTMQSPDGYRAGLPLTAIMNVLPSCASEYQVAALDSSDAILALLMISCQ